MKEGRKTRRIWPSFSEARWFILAGSAYGLLSFIPILYEPIRETVWSWLQGVGGPVLVGAVFALLPAAWTILLTSPLPHTSDLLYIAVPMSAALGGLAAYLLKALLNVRRHG
ncbi:MAG TPA: hypothetical protein GXX30_11470 [Firmicutes bacterium]|nr:hypothetical protein [Candidatus Fermentithermobacillaceae bacterium]